MMFTREQFDRAIFDLGATPIESHFDDLQSAYSSPKRHYHSHTHVSECLNHLARVYALLAHPAEVEIAIWYHDAVYDAHANDNEIQSANLARLALTAAAAPDDTIDRICKMIIATQTHLSFNHDSATLLDIDLGILGASTTAFEQYDHQIRREYHWVPEALYRSRRADVLAMFLQRDKIFVTDFFHELYEEQARINLTNKIVELRQL